MFNDKCSMINDKGFALVAMVFILVSFISVVFLVCYPLVKEAREDTSLYIIDRKDYRFGKALFGEAIDQSVGKLAHLGGLFGDYFEDEGWSGLSYKQHKTKVIARLYGTMSYVTVPLDYRYLDIWQGYWGKRYLHVLPSDDWDYGPAYFRGRDPTYTPYDQPYAKIRMGGSCSGTSPQYGNSVKRTSYNFTGYDHIYVEVKDYSKDRRNQELRLILIGDGDGVIYFEADDGAVCTNDDYVLCRFRRSHRLSEYGDMSRGSGQRKLMIQVKKHGTASWITMDTRLLCVPCSVAAYPLEGRGILTFAINFYG